MSRSDWSKAKKRKKKGMKDMASSNLRQVLILDENKHAAKTIEVWCPHCGDDFNTSGSFSEEDIADFAHNRQGLCGCGPLKEREV